MNVLLESSIIGARRRPARRRRFDVCGDYTLTARMDKTGPPRGHAAAGRERTCARA